ncbi:MAG: MFS transporter [Enterobacter hormaechei]
MATIYLIGFQFAKQSAAIFPPPLRNMYDRVGFQETHLELGCFVLAIMVVSAFTLSGRRVICRSGAAALTIKPGKHLSAPNYRAIRLTA